MADPTPSAPPAQKPASALDVAQLAAKIDAEKPSNVAHKEWRRHRQAHGHMVLIRSHFKSIFLVPMAIISLVLGIFSVFQGNPGPESQVGSTLGLIWVVCFCFYMNIFIFEWSRPWTYGLIVTLACFMLLGFALNGPDFQVWTALKDFLKGLHIQFSQQTYLFFAIFFGICSFVSWIRTRMNYVVMESNEIQIFKNALFGDRERVSMLNPRVEVRVTDMLEYFHPFYRSGQIIIHAPDRTIVLDNVLNIRRIERITDKLGSSLQVRVQDKG